MLDIGGRIEGGVDLAGVVEEPVVDDPDHIGWPGRLVGVLDDKAAVEASFELFAAGEVRVVPERAGIGGRELVGVALPGFDWRLGHTGYAVGGVGDPDAVPVHCGRHRQLVAKHDSQRVAEPHP